MEWLGDSLRVVMGEDEGEVVVRMWDVLAVVEVKVEGLGRSRIR